MKYKFDLERALKGDELITGSDIIVTGFKQISGMGEENASPYMAFIKEENHTFTAEGKLFKHLPSSLDIFMRYPELKEGMKILVKDDDRGIWVERIFLFKDKRDNVITVHSYSEDDYVSGKPYNAFTWKHWKFIEEPVEEPAMEIQVKINGKEGKLSDISTETFEKLKKLGL